MERDPRAYLWDVREAAEAILEFSRSHAPAWECLPWRSCAKQLTTGAVMMG